MSLTDAGSLITIDRCNMHLVKCSRLPLLVIARCVSALLSSSVSEMLPVSGPIVKNVDGSYYFQRKTWYRQKRPYNLVLPFTYERGWTFSSSNAGDPWRWGSFARGASSSAAYAQAYSRLVEKLGEPAGLGIDLTQWRQADAMISKRANQLTAFTRALVKRSPVGVAASLSLSLRDVKAVMRTRYGVARSLSDLWLEFWFGWKPMVTDIGTALEVMDRPVPWGKIRGVRELWTPYGVVQPAPPKSYREEIAYAKRVKVSLGIEVRITNPNVALLQQFGLLNAAQIAWDAVPWSFVVDWFANVNSWLGSFTDFAGYDTGEGYVKVTKGVHGATYWPDYPGWGGPGIGVHVSRESVATLPRPALQFKELSLKPVRALTAISLLTQKLPQVSPIVAKRARVNAPAHHVWSNDFVP